jgi:hypothetical protein
MTHFLYSRHFIALTCFTIVLAAVGPLHLINDLTASFALYGALHASALVLALRMRQSIWKRSLFITVAAVLSATALHIGMIGMRASAGVSGSAGLYAVLGFSAAIGAASYGALIRVLVFPELALRALAVIAIGCILASDAAFLILTQTHSFAGWRLAVFWWYAFSGGLWYFDQQSCVYGLSAERTCSGRRPKPKS